MIQLQHLETQNGSHLVWILLTFGTRRTSTEKYHLSVNNLFKTFHNSVIMIQFIVPRECLILTRYTLVIESSLNNSQNTKQFFKHPRKVHISSKSAIARARKCSHQSPKVLARMFCFPCHLKFFKLYEVLTSSVNWYHNMA